MIRVSVVIPAYNEALLLPERLRAKRCRFVTRAEMLGGAHTGI